MNDLILLVLSVIALAVLHLPDKLEKKGTLK